MGKVQDRWQRDLDAERSSQIAQNLARETPFSRNGLQMEEQQKVRED